ncbi:MAG: GNAT family N-acetyltransferase, partial [Bosea sp. (in: a-proteobacteria)]
RAIWNQLWQGYLTFYESGVADAVSDTTFTRLTSGTEPMGGFIAEDETGRAIGLVHWVTHRTCWSTRDTCYLQDLFVSPDVRGGGHGRALIQAVYAHATAMNCQRVYWQTHETNKTAQELYNRVAEHSGFIVYRMQIE